MVSGPCSWPSYVTCCVGVPDGQQAPELTGLQGEQLRILNARIGVALKPPPGPLQPCKAPMAAVKAAWRAAPRT